MGLTKENLSGACGNAATELNGNLQLPGCERQREERFGPAQEYSYVLRLRGDNDAETMIELQALENARVEVLSQIGQALEVHAEDLDREAIREATNEAIREITRAERELRAIQRERAQQRAEIERERTEQRAEMEREQRELQQELQQAARDRQREIRELQREAERATNTMRFEFRATPPAPPPPPPPEQ